MFASNFNRNVRCGVLALALTAAAGLASAETMHVVLDTSGFTGYAGAGWLDLQFNPGSATAALAGATVSNLAGFNAAVAAQLSGDAAGSLAAGYQLDNGTGYNDVFSAVHLGGKVSFDVSFSGAADPTGQLAGALFGVALYGGADGNTPPLGNADNNSGNLTQFAWQPALTGHAGSVTTTVFDGAVVTVSAVPEPSSWLMLGAGLALVGVATRRKQRAAA